MRWNAKEWVDRGKRFFDRPILPSPTRAINWLSLGRGLIIVLLVYAVGVFYVRTIRPGHQWAGDFSLYIRHAHNLVNHLPYSDTRFTRNPNFPTYSPSSYPPVYPALLATIYKFRGPDLDRMKYIGIGAFLGILLLLSFWLRHDLPFTAMFVLLATLGFHPSFWEFKDKIYSDVPFLFFMVLAMFVWEWIRTRPRPNWGASVAGGVALYAAYGTRSIGLVLVAAVVLRDLLQNKRVSTVTWRALAVLAVFIVAQGLFLYNDSGYISLMSWDWRRSLSYLHDYFGMVADLWENGEWPGLKMVLFCGTSLAAVAGYLYRVRLGIRELEIFVPLYAMAMVFWSSDDGVRYIFPLVPFYFYYALVGIEAVIKRGSWRTVILLGWVAAAALTYEAVYAQTSFGPFLDNVRAPESRAVFRYIRLNLSPDAVIVAREPRVFSLYTGRRCAIYHLGSDADLWNFFHQIKAGYIVLGRFSYKDRDFLRDFIIRSGDNLKPIFRNYEFTLYQIQSFPE